jgi:RNA polymerase sigma-70 factor (ECF subfamily)
MVRENQDQQYDLAEYLQAALARLPRAQREIVVLKACREKTFSEIARLLGISPNTAASRYRYGMEKLRKLLKGSAS